MINRILKSFNYKLEKLQPHSPELVGEMNTLLQGLKRRGLVCKTIMDVGANAANWSRMAAQIFTDATFFLIEPQVEMQPNLEKFCSEFIGSSFFPGGAGASTQSATFTVWDDLAGSSFLPKASTDLEKQGKQRVVEITTIDNLIETGRTVIPELMKLDIQGYELEALKGASKTFGITEVYILEVSFFSFEDAMPVFSDVIRFMGERNYVAYDFGGFLRRPLDGALGQCDICFVKKDGFLRSSHSWA